MKNKKAKVNLSGRNRPLDIKRTPSNKRWTVADYIADAIGERSLRDAADWFNAELPEIFHRKHSSVACWVNGEYDPDDVFIHALKTYYAEGDPRHALAAEILALRDREAEAV